MTRLLSSLSYNRAFSCSPPPAIPSSLSADALSSLPDLMSVLQAPIATREHLPRPMVSYFTSCFNDALECFLSSPSERSLTPLMMLPKALTHSARAGVAHRHRQAAQFRNRLDRWNLRGGPLELWSIASSRVSHRGPIVRSDGNVKARVIQLCREGAYSKAVKALIPEQLLEPTEEVTQQLR